MYVMRLHEITLSARATHIFFVNYSYHNAKYIRNE